MKEKRFNYILLLSVLFTVIFVVAISQTEFTGFEVKINQENISGEEQDIVENATEEILTCNEGELRGTGELGECGYNNDICDGGVWVPNARVTPTPEICLKDSLDNNCDGIIDNFDNCEITVITPEEGSTHNLVRGSKFLIELSTPEPLRCLLQNIGIEPPTTISSVSTSEDATFDDGGGSTAPKDPFYTWPGYKTFSDFTKSPITTHSKEFTLEELLKPRFNVDEEDFKSGTFNLRFRCYGARDNIISQTNSLKFTINIVDAPVEETTPEPIEIPKKVIAPEVREPIPSPTLATTPAPLQLQQPDIDSSAEIAKLETLLSDLKEFEEPTPVFCGDKLCNGAENCVSCSADCGICPDAAPEKEEKPNFIVRFFLRLFSILAFR